MIFARQKCYRGRYFFLWKPLECLEIFFCYQFKHWRLNYFRFRSTKSRNTFASCVSNAIISSAILSPKFPPRLCRSGPNSLCTKNAVPAMSFEYASIWVGNRSGLTNIDLGNIKSGWPICKKQKKKKHTHRTNTIRSLYGYNFSGSPLGQYFD